MEEFEEYSVGDIVIDVINGDKYFISRNVDPHKYTIVELYRKDYHSTVVYKEDFHSYTKLSLNSKLKKL
jgi:hypothetical protein